jgi:hypothetical protein
VHNIRPNSKEFKLKGYEVGIWTFVCEKRSFPSSLSKENVNLLANTTSSLYHVGLLIAILLH